MKFFNTEIDTTSFLRKGVPKIKEDFFVGLITGYQGTGKSYLGIYLLNKFKKGQVIYTNIHSFKNDKYEVHYFTKIEEILDNYEENLVFLIDELSKKYMGKDCKKDNRFYSWLQQSRKRKRIVLLLTQEYIQVPSWLRGVANVVYTTSKVKFLPLFITYRGYAELSEDSKEWNIVATKRYIYKRNKFIAQQYDTFEPIEML